MISGSPAGQEPQGLTATLLVAAILMFGAASCGGDRCPGMTRTGARRVLAVVAPGRLGAPIATAGLLAGSGDLRHLILTGDRITWAPLPEPMLP